ncbi:MAG: histidine phosphotransferase family protein [Stellaceae bacterium]
MSDDVDFRVLELLCGRLCHELVSPIGAINNGIELLDEDDPDFVKDAMALIAQSARKAGQRLQFYRFAYGTAGGSAAAVDGRELSAALLEGGKVRSEWAEDAQSLAPPWQRLACNLVIVAADILPRGGAVRVCGQGGGVEVAAEGDVVTLQPEVKAALAGGIAADALTARTVHAFYTMRLAGAIGAKLEVREAPNRAGLTALPGG